MLEFTTASLAFSLSILSLLLYFILLQPLSPPTKTKTQTQIQTPCPHSYPVIGNLIGFLRNRHRFHDWVTDMLSSTTTTTIQVNGFLGLSHGICTANPTNIDHLLRSNFSNFIKGSRFNSVAGDFLGDGIFAVDGDLWFTQRKIASHEFNTKSLRNFISNTVRSQISDRLIPYLSETSDALESIDLQDVFQKFAFDNICNVAFGVDPQSLSKNVTVNSLFIRAFECAVSVSLERFVAPVAAIWKLKRFLNIGSERKFKEAIKVINDYALSIVESKEKEYQTREEIDEDLLSRFMNSTSNLGFRDQYEKRKFLRDIGLIGILRDRAFNGSDTNVGKTRVYKGRDTTSTALTWFFWLLAGHPRCERLIYDEISSSTAAVGASFSYDELKKFNYLHAALSESLRLFPPVPINTRLTVADDTLPDGTHVRRGWFADYSAYAMGRMESLWGPDCREFRPERWLDSDGNFQPSDQFKFAVFHCGPRVCLGKEMAYVQIKSVTAAVICEFEVEAVDGGGCAERMMNPPYMLSLLLKMKGGLPVRLKSRRVSTSEN